MRKQMITYKKEEVLDFISILTAILLGYLLVAYWGLLYNHEGEGIITNLEYSSKDGHYYLEIDNYYTSYEIKEYNNAKEFKKYIGKKVKYKYKHAKGSRPKVEYCYLISITDMNGNPIPYKNPYKYLVFRENKVVLVSLTILLIFSLVYFVRLDSKRKEEFKIFVKKTKRNTDKIFPEFFSLADFKADKVYDYERLDDININEHTVVNVCLTSNIFAQIDINYNISAITKYEIARMWVHSIFIKGFGEQFSLKDFLDEYNIPSKFIFYEDVSFKTNKIDEAVKFISYIKMRIDETCATDQMRKVLNGTYWPSHLAKNDTEDIQIN